MKDSGPRERAYHQPRRDLPKGSGQAPGCSNTAGATQLSYGNRTCSVALQQLVFSAMGRKVDLDDLLDATQVAELLGLSSRGAVSVYRQRYEHFPEPILERSSGRCQFWLRQDVVRWRQLARGSDE